MIEKIKSAISNAIWEEFHSDYGEDMTISPETVNMDVPEGGFTYRCIDPQYNTELKGMGHINHSFSVNFYPKNTLDINEQLDSVAERLYILFEIIYTVGDKIPIYCRNKSSTKSDDVLVFTFDIEMYFTVDVEKEENMENVELKQKVGEYESKN